MKKYTQMELVDEGFWNVFNPNPAKNSIVRGALGAAGAALKGGKRALDYVAPEIMNPLHKAKAVASDIGKEAQKGWDIGFSGRQKAVADMLLDVGYLYNPNTLTKTGKNIVCTARKIESEDEKGNPITSKKSSRVLMDRNLNILEIDGRRPKDTYTNQSYQDIKTRTPFAGVAKSKR